jgi:hypothetical protein
MLFTMSENGKLVPDCRTVLNDVSDELDDARQYNVPDVDNRNAESFTDTLTLDFVTSVTDILTI